MAENNISKSKRGGRRPGSGRKKGSATQKTRDIANRAAEEGLTPLEYMLSVMRDESLERAERMDAAKSAAPYIHPKLSTTVLSGDEKNPVAFTVMASWATSEIQKRNAE